MTVISDLGVAEDGLRLVGVPLANASYAEAYVSRLTHEHEAKRQSGVQ